MVAGDAELFQFVFKLMKVHAEVEKCADEHVAADAAENIEIKGLCFGILKLFGRITVKRGGANIFKLVNGRKPCARFCG